MRWLRVLFVVWWVGFVTARPIHNVYMISDPHFDSAYHAGAPDTCLFGHTGLRCCRATDIALRGYRPASPWGSYKCDSPLQLLRYLFRQMEVDMFPQYPPAAVVMLGDVVNHHDMRQTFKQNMKDVRTFSDLIPRSFREVPIVPVIGNHDSWFVDQAMAPRWHERPALYRHLWESWAAYLPASQRDNFTRSGVYVTNLTARVQFMVLNGLMGAWNNWFLRGVVDPGFMLAWADSILHDARVSGRRVIVLSHFPIGSPSTTPTYNHGMTRLLREYKDVVLSGWFGHTHRDELRLMSRDSDLPVLYTIPSMMPDGHDPMVRVVQLDDQGNTLDYHQYSLSLQRLLDTNTANWTRQYSAKAAYGLKDMTAASWIQWWYAARVNRTRAHAYVYNYDAERYRTCDWSCVQGMLDAIMA